MSLIVSVSGIRGIVGQTITPAIAGQTITPAIAAEFAAAFATTLRGGRIVIGRDSRPSGGPIRDAVVEAMTTCGCSVIDLGVVSTPGTAMMIIHHQAAGGLVITASHNPGEWNGLKFLTAEGVAPPLEVARQIWALRDAGEFASVADDQIGQAVQDSTTHDRHVAAVCKIVDPERIAARRFRVVLDSVNGAGGAAGKMLLEALGCEVVHLNGEPTGDFAHTPEPTANNLTDLCEVVRREKGDIGFAQDPDADRLAIVDEQGTYIGEEYTLALAAKQVFATQPGPAATNLSTSRMIDDLAKQAGGPCAVHRSAVGEANVVHAMKRHNCVIGGEGNGGVIYPPVVAVRDSLVAMALVLQLLAQENTPLSSIVAGMPRYTIIKHKFDCDQERIAQVLEAVKSRFAGEQMNDLDGVRIDWPEGWVHVRGSNTEPIIRIIAEAADKQTADSLANRIRDIAHPILK